MPGGDFGVVFPQTNLSERVPRSGKDFFIMITMIITIKCCRDAGSAKMALLVPKGIARYPDTGDSVKVCHNWVVAEGLEDGIQSQSQLRN
jgi:hypothetical protein